MKVQAVWQFFEAERDGNAIHLFAPGARYAHPHASTSAGRRKRDGLCLSDYILDPEDGRRDHLALFVVTAGEGIRERVRGVRSRPASSSRRTPSRRWPSRPPKAAPNGCIAASARTGAFPIRPR